MKNTIIAATITFSMAVPAAATTLTDTFSGYFALGDSLSDDGKLGLPLPYFEGQFSSGPVWSEIIGEKFENAGGAYVNLALGGATAGDTNTNAYPVGAQPFATFNSQIDVLSGIASSAFGENPLIQVLFGANDIFQQGGGAAASAANAVADGIIRISQLGSQFDDFIVSNLPSVASLPNVDVYNATLAARLDEIVAMDINIIRVDQNVFQADLFPRLESLGVINTDTPCLITPTLTDPGFDCTITGINPDGSLIRDLDIADTYYLIDSVHPSGVPQSEFANFALTAIDANIAAMDPNQPSAVPLPAALPLMIFGLAGLGFAGRRRRAA